MTHSVLIAGAGIGGLAAALACAQRGCEVNVLEAVKEFKEVGAGIQLGPNAMKVIEALGLQDELLKVACQPEAIVISSAASGKPISRMLLGDAALQKYGQRYVTMHRADLHAILLQAAQRAGVQIHGGQSLSKYEHCEQYICRLDADLPYKSNVLIGADGLWSQVRAQMLGDGAPRSTGHAAYRSFLPASAVPDVLRTPHTRVWWARDVHVVAYPMRCNTLWNLVVLAEMKGEEKNAQTGWSLDAQHEDVMRLFKRSEPQLKALLEAGSAGGWRRWNLFDRAPITAAQMAQSRVALLGDAAHPMLPYLAQGAAMALEDAWVLARCLSETNEAPQALQTYAQIRAPRNARVVKTAQRNGRIFHMSGVMAVARDAVLALQGTSVVGMPWLYGESVI